MNETIKFGTKIKDSLTGFTGFVIARCEQMDGRIRYEVIPEMLKDGIPQQGQWLDRQRIIQIENQSLPYGFCKNDESDDYSADYSDKP